MMRSAQNCKVVALVRITYAFNLKWVWYILNYVDSHLSDTSAVCSVFFALLRAGWSWRCVECCGISPGICLLCVSGKYSLLFQNLLTSKKSPPSSRWLSSLVSTVPPLPVPLVPEETQVPHSAECHRPMQPLPARPEERVAADLPHFGRRALHPPHQHPQTPGQDRWLRGLRGGGQFVSLYLS